MSVWPRRVFRIWGPICGKWPSMGMCSMSILRMCGSWCPCSGGVQTTSTKWRSMPIPTASTPRRSLRCKRTMQTCGGRCPISSKSCRRWWKCDKEDRRLPVLLLFYLNISAKAPNIVSQKPTGSFAFRSSFLFNLSIRRISVSLRLHNSV